MTPVSAPFRDDRGAALVEFAMIAPVLLTLLLGMFELGYNYYMEAQLQGAIQKAARNSSLQSASGANAVIDGSVAEAVHAIVPDATLTFSRKAYASFNDVRRAEDYTDVEKDGVCNNGDPFEDANGNGTWDRDRGSVGGGGARDAVLYVVQVSYPRAFAAAEMVGLSPTLTTQAITVLRNQPWDAQKMQTGVGNCA